MTKRTTKTKVKAPRISRATRSRIELETLRRVRQIVESGAAEEQVQVLTGMDLLSSASLTPLEIPELPRNGRPGVVYIRQPSAKAMIRIFGQESAAELREQVQSSREMRDQQMARMIAGLVEDGQGNLLFTPEQADHLLDMHYAVFQRLAGAINNAFQGTGDDMDKDADSANGKGTGDGTDANPFVPTDSSDLPTV